jgi:SHS2 domain-containing protein
MSWRTFEHQADLGLIVDAPDGPALFADAGLAFFATVCDLERVEERETYELAGRAANVEDLLVDWLNDLIFLFEARGVVCRSIAFHEWGPTHYRAELRGEPADPSRHDPRDLVKAATYHGLSVTEEAGGWHARVILDV